jgi:hypothetical protein
MALAIANDNHCTKAKAPSTLDHFCYPVDLDDALFKFKIVWIDMYACHDTSTLSIANRQELPIGRSRRVDYHHS